MTIVPLRLRRYFHIGFKDKKNKVFGNASPQHPHRAALPQRYSTWQLVLPE